MINRKLKVVYFGQEVKFQGNNNMIVQINTTDSTLYLQPKYINAMTLDADSVLILWNDEGKLYLQFDNDTLRSDAITLLITNGVLLTINYINGIIYINPLRIKKIILSGDTIMTITCMGYGDIDAEFEDIAQRTTALDAIIAAS